MPTHALSAAIPEGLVGIDLLDADVDSLVLDVFVASPPAQKEHIIAQLVGKIYRDAPLIERSHLLEHLLKPLGVLSFLTVANGIFARFRFHSEWPQLKVQPRVSRILCKRRD